MEGVGLARLKRGGPSLFLVLVLSSRLLHHTELSPPPLGLGVLSEARDPAIQGTNEAKDCLSGVAWQPVTQQRLWRGGPLGGAGAHWQSESHRSGSIRWVLFPS